MLTDRSLYAYDVCKDLLVDQGSHNPYWLWLDGLKMLYTASAAVFKKIKRKVKVRYISKDQGNDDVVPDQFDLDQYRSQALTWEGFKVNYLAKLMRSEADEWMRRVSEEAVYDDVVLVDEERDAEHSCRKFLAEMMVSMFSGRLKLRYMGELTS